MTAIAIAALLLRTSAPAPALELRAAPLARILGEAGRFFGEPMRAAPAIGDEIALASLPEGTNASAFRTAIAETFAADWRRSENGEWVLNRSEIRRAAERRQSEKARAAEVRAALARLTAPLRETPNFDDAAADRLAGELRKFSQMPMGAEEFDYGFFQKAQSFDRRGPSTRALMRVLLRVTPEMIAETRDEGRTVYSTRPTRMQRPMPFEMNSIFDAFAREQGAWANAAATLEMPQDRYFSALTFRKDPISKPPGFATFQVRSQYGNRYVALKIYSIEGKTLAEANESLSGERGWGTEPTAIADTFVLTTSPESRAFSKVMAFGRPDGPRPDPSPFFDVRARDPLSYGASDFFLSYARDRGKPMVARVPDEALYLGFMFGEEPKDNAAPQREDWRRAAEIVSRAEVGDFLVVKPKDAERARARFFDRKDLARAIAIVRANPRLTTDLQADLAATLPESASQSLLVLFVSGLARQDEVRLNDPLARLFGLLDADQRKRAASEAGLPLASLDERQNEAVRKFVYEGDEWSLRFTVSYSYDRSASAEQNEASQQAKNREQELYYNGYMREPTFSLPNGLPADASLKVQRDGGDRVRSGPTSQRWGMAPGMTFDPEGMADAKYQSDNPARFPWANSEWSRRNWDQLSLVNEERLTIKLLLTESLSGETSLSSIVPLDEKTYRLEELPAPFLTAYREAYTRKVKQYANQPVGQYYGDYGFSPMRRSAPP